MLLEIAASMYELESEKSALYGEKLAILFREMLQMCLWQVSFYRGVMLLRFTGFQRGNATVRAEVVLLSSLEMPYHTIEPLIGSISSHPYVGQ